MTKQMKVFRDAVVRGAARVLDLGAVMDARENTSASPAERDAKALRGDWRRVGEDLRWAMAQHGRRPRQRSRE